MLTGQGISVVCCTICMYDSVREWNRANIPGYVEVYVKASMETLRRRNQKGLYSDGTDAFFMNLSDYEQFTMPVDALGEQMKFLAPEMTVKANFVEGQPVSISLPKTVVATVVETEPALKGQTVSSSGGKPAILDNGVRVQVPLFIEQDEKIVVNTETLEYVERAK